MIGAATDIKVTNLSTAYWVVFAARQRIVRKTLCRKVVSLVLDNNPELERLYQLLLGPKSKLQRLFVR